MHGSPDERKFATSRHGTAPLFSSRSSRVNSQSNQLEILLNTSEIRSFASISVAARESSGATRIISHRYYAHAQIAIELTRSRVYFGSRSLASISVRRRPESSAATRIISHRYYAHAQTHDRAVPGSRLFCLTFVRVADGSEGAAAVVHSHDFPYREKACRVH